MDGVDRRTAEPKLGRVYTLKCVSYGGGDIGTALVSGNRLYRWIKGITRLQRVDTTTIGALLKAGVCVRGKVRSLRQTRFESERLVTEKLSWSMR